MVSWYCKRKHYVPLTAAQLKAAEADLAYAIDRWLERLNFQEFLRGDTLPVPEPSRGKIQHQHPRLYSWEDRLPNMRLQGRLLQHIRHESVCKG